LIFDDSNKGILYDDLDKAELLGVRAVRAF
jgi:hypothetical protein